MGRSPSSSSPSLGIKDLYLILYNSANCLGWLWVLVLTLVSLAKGIPEQGLMDALANVYFADGLAMTLFYAQSAALLEIVHAALGLVRSPVLVTAMQVGSRLVALAAVVLSPQAQAQWGAGLMVLSWSLVEVPRYAFYVVAIVTGDATKKTPYPLFWLRYSLFAVLYPTGITGELTVMRAASQDPIFVNVVGHIGAWIYSTGLPLIYLPGSPFMIMNMIANRKSAFRKRFAKPPPPPRGLVFPLDKRGERSSTQVNKDILAAAVGAVNPTKAQAIQKTKNWRFGYVKHLIGMVEEQCKSPEAALKIAQAGLDKAYEVFQFVTPDGASISLKDAMAAKSSDQFKTGFVQGKGTKPSPPTLRVPYKGQTLTGKDLEQKVHAWVDYGTIEKSAGDAIIACIQNPQWLDLSNRHFVLLGAGSAMGPFLVLMALGANVIAIDLDRPQIWKRLIDIAKASPGTLTFPLKVEQSSIQSDEQLYEQAGCNLFTHTPMIRDWLLQVCPGKNLTVGSYAYLDGALHVQVSLAMDAICRDLSEKRPGTSLAYLCTPTDLHLIPKEAHQGSLDNYKVYSKKLFCIMMHTLSNGKFLRKNARKPVPGQGGDFYLVNGISVAQGPNYALAKRMQHWRAVIARSKGCIVSSNIAPSTSTVSVVHNRTFAWAYEGMPYFKPYEIFAPETSNAVMSALLLNELNNNESVGNPKTVLANPNQLFSYGAMHGGTWRCAYEVDSIGESSVLIYFSRLAMPYVSALAAVAVAAAAVRFAF